MYNYYVHKSAADIANTIERILQSRQKYTSSLEYLLNIRHCEKQLVMPLYDLHFIACTSFCYLYLVVFLLC